MDAVSAETYKVWFGGTYSEHWSEDYRLSVSYSGRKFVEAVYDGGRWLAAGGDAELAERLRSRDCPALTRDYFQAAATAAAAVKDCIGRGLALDRMDERFSFSGNPLIAPELMRTMMDDYGMPMDIAFAVCSRCCGGEMGARGVNIAALYELQPRTAVIIPLIAKAAEDTVAAMHDARKPEYRSPSGAVRCGDEVELKVRVTTGKLKGVFLVLWSDNGREEREMERRGELFSCRFQAPGEPMAMWYCFRVETEGRSRWVGPDGSGYFARVFSSESAGFRLTVYAKDFDTPAWFRRSVMYQIFPDRFAFSDDGTAERGIEYHRALGQTPELHGSADEPVRWQPREFEAAYSPDDFYGGTFRGIEAKLPYLKKFGVSCIYLNPICEARSNHRYDTSCYTRPDPILGGMEDFESLCSAAREQGMRVILDGVFSHTGADSVYFDRYGHYGGRGACAGQSSEYYDWYDFRSFPDDYRCWWGFKDLPEVNELNPKWQSAIITGEGSAVKHWLRHGASGWRLDVADELPDPVLALIRRSVKEEQADAPIIGEVWEDAVIKESYGSRRRYALGSALDSVMNYPFRRAVLDFALGHSSAYALRDFLIGQQMNYPKPMYYSLMNLLGSHDVERLRSALASDVDIRSLSREEQLRIEFPPERLERALALEKLCAAIQFSVPGVPSIYYGDEQGMCGVCDPFNRLPFKEGERELSEYYAELSARRNAAPALSTGEAAFMAESRDVLLILRYCADGRDAFGAEGEDGAYLTVVNRGAESDYCADCSAAGLGEYRGRIKALTAETVRLR